MWGDLNANHKLRPAPTRLLVVVLGLFLMTGCSSLTEKDDEFEEDPEVTERNEEKRLATLQETNRDRLFNTLDNEMRAWRQYSSDRENQVTLEGYLAQYVQANMAAVLSGLDSESSRYKSICAASLYFIEDPIVVGPLVALLNDPDPGVVGNVLMALSRNADDRVPVEKIAPLTRSPHPDLRQNSVLVLGRLSSTVTSDVASDAIVAALTDETPTVRFNAVKAAGEGRIYAAAPLLLEALRDPWPGIRAHAALSLAALGKEDAIDLIRPLLTDRSDLARAAARSAILVLNPNASFESDTLQP